MANISKTHKRFSERLNNPEVLTNPEEFLGPNFEAVLNFWMILDGLSKDQWKTIGVRYWGFYNIQESKWFKAVDEAYKASDETIVSKFADNAAIAAYDFYGGAAGGAAGWATREIIGMHKLFDQQKTLTFLPMVLNVL